MRAKQEQYILTRLGRLAGRFAGAAPGGALARRQSRAGYGPAARIERRLLRSSTEDFLKRCADNQGSRQRSAFHKKIKRLSET
jgi:hypothetical protein